MIIIIASDGKGRGRQSREHRGAEEGREIN